MTRPKLVFSKSSGRAGNEFAPPADESDYRIYATYRRTASGAFMGDLKVVRTRDNRLLFPFDGAPTIGPFDSASAAREAARSTGEELVLKDRAIPEL